jgi:hypothetical protein
VPCFVAITNELFLLVSATGAINFPSNPAFLANAVAVRRPSFIFRKELIVSR